MKIHNNLDHRGKGKESMIVLELFTAISNPLFKMIIILFI